MIQILSFHTDLLQDKYRATIEIMLFMMNCRKKKRIFWILQDKSWSIYPVVSERYQKLIILKRKLLFRHKICNVLYVP